MGLAREEEQAKMRFKGSSGYRQLRLDTDHNPGPLRAHLVDGDGLSVGEASIESDRAPGANIEGPSTQVLLALWGHPSAGVRVSGGDAGVWEQWKVLPGVAFQFGTWD